MCAVCPSPRLQHTEHPRNRTRRVQLAGGRAVMGVLVAWNAVYAIMCRPCRQLSHHACFACCPALAVCCLYPD
jgi:hypothetical protein